MKSRPFRRQEYKKLVKICQQEGKQFVDSEFTPDTSSLFVDGSKKHNLVWKRSSELANDAQLFVDGASVHDVRQGILGNCWFVAACSALTHNDKLMDRVVPDRKQQNINGFVNGIFHFRFWRFGEWLDVVIDDFLPTENGHMVMAHSKEKKEFWSALLEKAFAKLYGCYELMVGGQLADALVEVSAGIPEYVDLNKIPKHDDHARLMLFHELASDFDQNSLLIAAIKPATSSEMEEQMETGLVKGHAYAISAVRQVELDNKSDKGLFEMFAGNERTRLIRLHNPWGEKEWNGAWSDSSPEWTQVSEHQKQKLGIIVEEDGEFWMHWNDFLANFTGVTICHLKASSWFGTSFNEVVIFGQWHTPSKPGKLDDRAGGCKNNGATWLLNPQYMFDVRDNGLTELLFALTQHDFDDDTKSPMSTIDERKEERPRHTTGMQVLKVEDNRIYRLHRETKLLAVSDYVRTRTVLLKMNNLEQGRYIVVPSTFKPEKECKFMLRILSPINEINVKKLEKDEPSNGFFSCCRAQYQCITRINVRHATNIENKKGGKDVDPYVSLNCEGKKVRTQHRNDTYNPEWNTEFVFYRKKPAEPIIVEIWDANYVKDACLGRAILQAPITNEVREIDLSLFSRSDADTPTPGKIHLSLATYDDCKIL